jgi:hypothetical protein
MTSKKSDADKWRLRQAQKLLKLFEDAHGREMTSADDLRAWFKSPQGKAALAPHLDKDGKLIPDHA